MKHKKSKLLVQFQENQRDKKLGKWSLLQDQTQLTDLKPGMKRDLQPKQTKTMKREV